MRRVIGIDPGITGGVVALDISNDGHISVPFALATPTAIGMRCRRAVNEYDPRAMYLLLKELVDHAPGRCTVVLERASTRPGLAAQAVFRTGEGFGLWRGIIATLNVTTFMLTPQAWKRKQNLLHSDKRASVLCAKDKLPQLATLTATQHGIAEAALIAATAAGC
jgi:hypothetical protein